MRIKRAGKAETEGFGPEPDEPIALPIEPEIDLHPFRPDEIGDLVDDYLEEASRAGFREVRIIHGRGTGAARRQVEARLQRHPRVARFRVAPEELGGAGATLVELLAEARG